MVSSLRFIDVQFQGRPRVIATAVIQTSDGVALVDPGPSTSLETLVAELGVMGIRLSDVRALLLTHIHLDHAGGVGTLLRQQPELRVFVHERGARHIIDPSKLIDSASRLYGDQMSRLWGTIEPVPADRVTTLSDRSQVEIGSLRLDVAYTPGHASHHVSYLDRATGVAYVGDTAGIRIGLSAYNVPPTPPPDIDVEAWEASIARFREWSPSTMFLTHFGPVPDVVPHLDTLEKQLHINSERVACSLEEPGSDEERATRFAETIDRELVACLSEAEVAAYRQGVRFEHCWTGLARYWRKKRGL